ncbi:alpha/beta fold hydrolase [Kordia sp.]|uniref:thioesterase II family protein n=1 Tax=Kordia sp. TaxID=1965332 RepID=UPI0025C60E08|nr:alpha/beta fold hydrolase [Kordia sp.]MCH2195472.1 alpha/beta fold hydrolase [Kordia sp.]
MNKRKVQLFLLHFAGGSRYSFDFLKEYLSNSVECIPLELPGRGKRYGETLIRDKEAAIHDYCQQIRALRNKQPFVIYGHSMGATLGVSVANFMQKIGDPPSALIVTGNSGPGTLLIDNEGNEMPQKTRYLMNAIDFKNELIELGGAPDEVLNNDEIYNFFDPILRADFEVLEKESTYTEEGILLHVPIIALMGTEEKTSHQIDNWQRFTTEKLESNILDGNHFFIHNHTRAIANVIRNASSVVYAAL